MSASHLVATVVYFSAVSALAGCGDDDSDSGAKEAVVEAVKDHQTALLEEDAEGFCETMSPKQRTKLILPGRVLGGGATCEEGAEVAFDSASEKRLNQIERARDELTTKDIELRGDAAVVTYPSGRKQPLRKLGGEWLISGDSKRATN